jgi:S-layer protein
MTLLLTGTGTPGGVTLANVENLNINTTGAGFTIDSTDYAGLTALNVVGSGDGNFLVTAATTTSLSLAAASATGDFTVTGGKDVIVSGVEADDILITGASGSVRVVPGEEATDIVSVNSNKNLTSVTVTGGGIIAIGDGLTTLADVTFDDDAVTDTITTVTVTGNAGALTINSDNLASLSLSDTDQDATVTAAAGTRTLSLTIDGVTDTAAISDATATSITLIANGEDSDIDLTATAAKALAISGSAEGLALTAGNFTALKSITISGDVGVTSDVSGAAALTSITSTSSAAQDLTIANTATSVTLGAGDDTLTHADALGATQSINTGAGDDTVILGAALTAGANVNGGDGEDTISVIDAQVATNASAVISNFEILAVSDELDTNNLNVANFDSIQQVVLEAGSGGKAITGLKSDATVTLLADGTGNTTLTVTNAALGEEDVINLVVSEAANEDFFAFAVADVEIIHITSTDTATDNDPGDKEHTVGLSDDHTTLNVSGDAGLIIDTAMTSVETIDASSFDAGLTVNLTGNTNDAQITTGAGNDDITVADAHNTISAGDGDNVIVAGDGDNTITVGDGDADITVGDGDNTITGGESAGAAAVVVGDGNNTITLGDSDWAVTLGDGSNTVVLGAGDDTVTIGAAAVAGINSVTLGAGDDTVEFAFDTTAAGYYTSLKDIDTGDTLDFTGAIDDGGTVGNYNALGTKVVLGGAASFANYLDAAAAGAGDIVSWFQFNGNTFIVVDDSAEATFQDGQDLVVELVGLVDIADSVVTDGVLVIDNGG